MGLKHRVGYLIFPTFSRLVIFMITIHFIVFSLENSVTVPVFCRVIQKTFKMSQKQKPYILEICPNVQSSKTVHNACIYGYFKVVIGTWCATHKCSGNLQPLTFWKLFHFFPLGVPEGTIFAIIYCAFVSIIRAVLTFSICHFVQASKGFFFGELQQ